MRCGPAKKEEIESDEIVREMFEDVARTFRRRDFSERYSLLAYAYSNVHDKLFCFVADGARLNTCELLGEDGVPVRGVKLFELYNNYQRFFISVNNTDKVDLHGGMAKQVFFCWYEIYSTFIMPHEGLQQGQHCKEVLCRWKVVIGGMDIFLNLPIFYNLSFRFLRRMENHPLYFVMINDESFYDYFTGARVMPCPSMEKMVFLTGFTEFKGPPAGTINNRTMQAQIDVRNKLLRRVLELIPEQGGAWRYLDGVEDVASLLSENTGRDVIQLLAHHHEGFLINDKSKKIPLQDVMEHINLKRSKGNSLGNITLDAINCDNSSELRQFKLAGLGRVYYSYGLVDSIQMIMALFEMYSCRLADQLGWKQPYIDGTRHLPIIYSDVSRAFYITMNKKGRIQLD